MRRLVIICSNHVAATNNISTKYINTVSLRIKQYCITRIFSDIKFNNNRLKKPAKYNDKIGFINYVLCFTIS